MTELHALLVPTFVLPSILIVLVLVLELFGEETIVDVVLLLHQPVISGAGWRVGVGETE